MHLILLCKLCQDVGSFVNFINLFVTQKQNAFGWFDERELSRRVLVTTLEQSVIFTIIYHKIKIDRKHKCVRICFLFKCEIIGK